MLLLPFVMDKKSDILSEAKVRLPNIIRNKEKNFNLKKLEKPSYNHERIKGDRSGCEKCHFKTLICQMLNNR
ncbi:hypothetical protein CUU66_13630 [Peribacillus deserti]|uniref:Uncharacterized protein n=1 Tax=Peribacillus deserti TaxID=673318 RepID=A0A2N5M4P9_9BACI|nr:hypothetical protein CUU66_13630 [Peribacillus deserti]